MNKRAQTIPIYVFLTLMLAFATANSYLTVRFIGQSSGRGWIATMDHDRLVVAQANPTGPASVLHAGDEIIDLKGLQSPGVPAATSQTWMVK
ncbi:MAG TPA: hypothetical protein VK557_12050, partial [Pyrinomonadaceae bacterium]|nr:hypothetical protein [Pyrinomonadaceae bacterium]